MSDFLTKRTSLFILFLIVVFSLVPSLKAQNTLTNIQKQARAYREQGLELQREGKIDSAINSYQKAIMLDPDYCVAYNDLGIAFEIKGWRERAREVYLRAIEVNRNYPNSYSNLALLYEEEGNFLKAAVYWKRRCSLGDSEDPWVKKAKQRLAYIVKMFPEGYLEKEGIDLGEGVDQSALSNTRRALIYLNQAKEQYSRGDYAAALRKITTAEYLDPSNKEITEFTKKILDRLLQ